MSNGNVNDNAQWKLEFRGKSIPNAELKRQEKRRVIFLFVLYPKQYFSTALTLSG